MQQLLYGELVPWSRLVDPPADHAEEAACYRAALERAALPRPETLLDLGSGAGHNALHLKSRFRCLLADLSEDMLRLSRELNPECEHVAGDMRPLRLAAAVATAFVHTRPGGAAVFAPDALRGNFHESSDLLEGADGARALRGLAWTWDPDPADSVYSVEYAFLLRDGKQVRAVHDQHVEGLFSRELWRRVLETAGYSVVMIDRPLGDGEHDQIFLCRRAS